MNAWIVINKELVFVSTLLIECLALEVHIINNIISEVLIETHFLLNHSLSMSVEYVKYVHEVLWEQYMNTLDLLQLKMLWIFFFEINDLIFLPHTYIHTCISRTEVFTAVYLIPRPARLVSAELISLAVKGGNGQRRLRRLCEPQNAVSPFLRSRLWSFP